MNTSPTDTGVWRAVLPLACVALVFRLLFLLAMPRVLDTADAIHYVETAEKLASGDFFGYDPKIPVLYPLLGALASFLVSNVEWACRSISFLASVLTVLPVYLLARDLHGPAAARIAGLLVALWPWLADYACRVSTEATAVLLWISGVWLFTRGMAGSRRAMAGAVLSLFALALTRAEGLFILMATLPAAVILTWRPHAADWKRFGRFAIPAAALVATNTLYVRYLTGQTTANYRTGFILKEFDFQRFVQTAIETSSNVLPVMLGPLLFLFLGVGMFHPREGQRNPRLEITVLFFAVAQWGLSLFVLSPAPRYLMAPLVVLSIWSAAGIVLAAGQIAAWRPERRCWSRIPVIATLAFFLAHALVTVGSEHLGRRPREPREYKDAGRWMAENLEPGLIFTRKPQVGYYADMPSTGPALDDTLQAALSRARDAGAAYVVIDERYTAALVPGLRPLLDEANPFEDLELVKTFDAYPDAKVVVYRLKPQSRPDTP